MAPGDLPILPRARSNHPGDLPARRGHSFRRDAWPRSPASSRQPCGARGPAGGRTPRVSLRAVIRTGPTAAPPGAALMKRRKSEPPSVVELG